MTRAGRRGATKFAQSCHLTNAAPSSTFTPLTIHRLPKNDPSTPLYYKHIFLILYTLHLFIFRMFLETLVFKKIYLSGGLNFFVSLCRARRHFSMANNNRSHLADFWRAHRCAQFRLNFTVFSATTWLLVRGRYFCSSPRRGRAGYRARAGGYVVALS